VRGSVLLKILNNAIPAIPITDQGNFEVTAFAVQDANGIAQNVDPLLWRDARNADHPSRRGHRRRRLSQKRVVNSASHDVHAIMTIERRPLQQLRTTPFTDCNRKRSPLQLDVDRYGLRILKRLGAMRSETPGRSTENMATEAEFVPK